MSTFRSVKTKRGYSTVFRQWNASGTHCQQLHGYSPKVTFTFEGELDERNWVQDFGGFKRATSLIGEQTPDQWLKWLLDHTVIIAANDPAKSIFIKMEQEGIINLRIIPNVGAERFAEYICKTINDWVNRETAGRVKLISVQFSEHEDNSAIFINN